MITSMRRMVAPAGGFGRPGDGELARNVEQPAGILEKEVMMVTDVGVEIGVRAGKGCAQGREFYVR